MKKLKSFCFPDRSGYFSKCGITFVRRLPRLLTSYLRVESFLSLLINPHPNFSCMRNNTSARSWFWATQKLGFVSHPTRNLSRLEKDTEKHPSPSAKPEIYSFILRALTFSVGVLWRTIVLLHDSTILVAARWRRPKSIRAQHFLIIASSATSRKLPWKHCLDMHSHPESAGFPRYSPAFSALRLFVALQRGLHRY